jgi:D-sedoheptulose 7-phosphate isomerase
MNSLTTVSAERAIRSSIRESIDVKAQLLEQHVSIMAHLAEILADALRAGNKLVLFGNGGSAADAQHVAAELGRV